MFWVLVSIETDGGGRIHFVLGSTEVSHLVGRLVRFCFDLVCFCFFLWMDLRVNVSVLRVGVICALL